MNALSILGIIVYLGEQECVWKKYILATLDSKLSALFSSYFVVVLMMTKPMLYDSFGRKHNYLRISLAESCNLRCFYCMPDSHDDEFRLTRPQRMQPDEIEELASMFVRLGVSKIRLTGGEPLVRKEAADIIQRLSQLPVELTLTTNGLLVRDFIEIFHAAGIRSLNVSLDTLDKKLFAEMTERDEFSRVWQNIEILVREKFHVKINVVVIGGVNDHEIRDFIRWTKNSNVHVRFIEFMPFTGNKWQSAKVVSYENILREAEKEFSFTRLSDGKHETAKSFKPLGHAGTFAVISTMSAPFCEGCNRMRLTADGKMKNCLFSMGETDLLGALRRGEDVEALIRANVRAKERELGGQMTPDFEITDAGTVVNRSMIAIGG